MKKLLIYSLFTLSFHVTQAQETLPIRGWQGGGPGTGISMPYTPTAHVTGKTSSSAITWAPHGTILVGHLDWFGAMDRACAIWGQILATPYPITVGFYPSSSMTLPSGALAAAVSPNVHDLGGSMLSSTFYNVALAQYLGGSFAPPAEMITVVINETPPSSWYTGVDAHPGFSEYDLVTALVHEIGHALGFETSTTFSGGNVKWSYSGNRPNIFDSWIWDNATGDALGSNYTYLTDLTGGTTDFTNFCTGSGGYGSNPTSSNSVYFDALTASNVEL